MKELRINHPGAGEEIMRLCEGTFREDMDHSIANYYGSELAGGFVLNHYLGNSAAVHMAGTRTDWGSRDIIWMLFDYAFVQLRLGKLLAPVASDNAAALAQDLRVGFELEAVIADAYSPGRHLMVLTMAARNCRWLKIRPRAWAPGTTREGIPRHE